MVYDIIANTVIVCYNTTYDYKLTYIMNVIISYRSSFFATSFG